MHLIVNKSISKLLHDDIKADSSKWIRPGRGNVPALILSVHNQNTHVIRVREVFAKIELLSINIKNFGYIVIDVNTYFIKNHKEITLAGEENPDIVCQMLKA